MSTLIKHPLICIKPPPPPPHKALLPSPLNCSSRLMSPILAAKWRLRASNPSASILPYEGTKSRSPTGRIWSPNESPPPPFPPSDSTAHAQHSNCAPCACAKSLGGTAHAPSTRTAHAQKANPKTRMDARPQCACARYMHSACALRCAGNTN